MNKGGSYLIVRGEPVLLHRTDEMEEVKAIEPETEKEYTEPKPKKTRKKGD